MPSKRYVFSRTFQVVLTVFAVVSLTFFMIRWMPGGPEDYFMAQMMGQDISQERMAVMMEAYTNLRPDVPVYEQYINYMASMLQGDLGRSIWYQADVLTIVSQAMPWTIYLSAASMVIIFSIGILYGAAMAYWEASGFDYASSVWWIVIESIPYYVFAIAMLWFLAYTNSYFPQSGRFDSNIAASFSLDYIGSILRHSTLPILSLVITGIGGIALGMRGNSIRVLGEDYLRVARLRGLSETVISMRYVGRNAILPMYTGMMISIGGLFGGSVILETLFNYPGIGYYMFQAVSARDYTLMMGTFLFITVGVIIGVYIADLTYGFIDPRADDASSRETYATLTLASVRRRLAAAAAVLRNPRGVLGRVTPGDGRNASSGGAGGTGRSLSTSSQPVSANGGTGAGSTADLPFTKVSATTLSRREKARRVFDEFVLAPLRVILEDWRALVGILILSVFVLMGTVGVVLIEPPQALEGPTLLPPFQSMEFPFGTNDMGKGLFAQTVHATPAMLKMMAGGAVFATGMAIVWGVFSGYAGGTLDRTMMAIADILMTIPGLPLVIVISTIITPRDPLVIGVILTINGWAGFARALRSQVLTIREKAYVEASRTMGISVPQLMLKNIIPNLMPLVTVNFVTRARNVIVASVSLYFLGILPFTTLNWGVMLNMAYSSGTWYSMDAVHWIMVPILTIVVLSLGLILLGQGCDRIFNPRIRARHAKTTPDDITEVESR